MNYIKIIVGLMVFVMIYFGYKANEKKKNLLSILLLIVGGLMFGTFIIIGLMTYK